MIRSFSLGELARLVGTDLPANDMDFNRVSIDSRACQGALFVAIKGERHDGHDFIEQACANDCDAMVVERSPKLGMPHLVVEDTRQALGQIAHLNRLAFSGKIVALTGSSGKTTTKNMLRGIFDQMGTCLATRGNQNNEIGVPLTLLAIGAQHDFAVIEMGARKRGDINYLAEFVKPDVAMVLNAGSAHIGEFGGYENIVLGKGELYSQISAGGYAVLNMDDPAVSRWEAMISAGVNTVRYSSVDNGSDRTKVANTGKSADEAESAPLSLDVCISELECGPESSVFVIHAQGESHRVELPIAGEHNVNNALAAAAAALCVGANLSDIATGLSQFSAGPGRMHRIQLSDNLQLIDDTYNANPASMRAAANVLALHEGVRVAVLGDMAELGDDAEHYHRELGEYLRTKEVSSVYAVGTYAAITAKAFGEGAAHFDDKDSLQKALVKQLTTQTSSEAPIQVLVKGSRSAGMETLVSGLEGELS